MTVIKSISAKGFKSFAKKTELLFGNNYNCIIGPNGAGKSNVADLITFVLGKSSAKSMRAEKTANLIYNGGKNSKPFKEAEATVVFDNSDEIFPLKEKDIAITRAVNQKGISLYKINNKKMTRQQVVDFLSAASVDPDGHNIILQGDIVHFMEMRGEERREIIEDIAGISVYQEKKEKAMRELEKFQAKIGEIEIILTERNTYLKELKSERDQAVRYKELEENVKRSKATLIDSQLKKKKDDLKDVENNLKQHEEQKSKFEEKICSLKTEIESVKQNIKTINEEIELKGEKEQKELHKEIELLREELSKNKNRLETLQNELFRIDNRKKQLKLDRENLVKKINDIKEDIKKLTLEKNNYDKEEKTVALQIKSSKGAVEDDLDLHITRKQEMLYSFKDKEQTLLREKDKVSYLLDDISKKLSSENLIGDISELKKDFKEVADELNKKLNNDSMYASQLGKTRREIVEKNEKLATLRVRNIGIREGNAADLSIRQILKSGINGIFNTVGGLGQVDKKYSLALEVAAGSRINAVVVQDDLVASKCIKYLKEKKMGIVAFLPLNKMKSIPSSSIKKGQGVHGSALDLVKFESKFSNVFSYVFGNTLVVDNVETARSIGIGSARMVTLEGDLMETSGAMIGGYRKRKEGLGFKEKDVIEEIAKLEGEVSHLQNTINTLEQNKTENEALLFTLREQKTNFEIEIMKIEKTTGGIDAGKLHKDEKELKTQLNKLNKEIENVQQDVLSLNKEIQLLREKKQKEIRDLDANSLESQRLFLREKIVSLSSDIKNMTNQLDTMLIPEYEKIGKILKDHDKEVDDFTGEMKVLQVSIKEMNSRLKEKEVIEQKFYSEFKNLFNKRNKIQEQLQQKENNLVRDEERVIALNSRFNAFSVDRARITAEIAGLQKEFEAFAGFSLRKGVALDELKIEIQSNEKEIAKFGNVNLKALEVYESLEKEYGSLVDKSNKLKQEKEDVVAMMQEIESKKKGLFMKTFNEIEKNFRGIFNQLTLKGNAYLELEDTEDPFSGGLDIKVKIAGNKYLDIKGLSGGEKTMAALAFIFAIQEYHPASFYLFDEVDAALDKPNSFKLSKLFAQYSQKAQYIVISHNDAIISEANQIYGVSMNDGVSKVVSLKI
ncbi:chromosome segregation protein SMC [Candidatus Woesearchaeota archaeon]|nr:chromosome segregation protein SMC [Candidatus Woesearchaeota archaeon]